MEYIEKNRSRGITVKNQNFKKQKILFLPIPNTSAHAKNQLSRSKGKGCRRGTNKQTDKQTDKQASKQTDKHTNKQTDRQTDRQTQTDG